MNAPKDAETDRKWIRLLKGYDSSSHCIIFAIARKWNRLRVFKYVKFESE